MQKPTLTTVSVMLAVGLPILRPSASAQVIAPAQTALEAASAGAVASRSPGNMVAVGVANALAFADLSRARVVITQTSRPTSRLARLIADTVAEIFAELDLMIRAFDLLLQNRAGRQASPAGLIRDAADLSGGQLPRTR
ncbi:MAG: hypothetical protein ACE5HE_07630 [Phycisphaerae bacterium]